MQEEGSVNPGLPIVNPDGLTKKQYKRRGLVWNKDGNVMVIRIKRIETNFTKPGEVNITGDVDEIFKSAPQVILHNVINEYLTSAKEECVIT